MGGYSCSDSRGAGMKWMYESVQRRIHSLGYLKHPNLAHLIGSLNQYPLRVLWRWEKCESLTDVLGHFWKTKLSQDFSKCPRSIKKGAPVTILSQVFILYILFLLFFFFFCSSICWLVWFPFSDFFFL